MSTIEEITYSFVQFYYKNLHENPTQLFQAYTTDANLTHSKIPSNNDDHEIINKSIETQNFTNKSEIEQFYSNSNIKNCKIRVSSIDFQSFTIANSILISIIGELALTDESPVYRFTQTFILVPGKVENCYDISNDVFRLIPDDDFELKQDDQVEEPIAPVLNGSAKKQDTEPVLTSSTEEIPEKKESKDLPKEKGESKKEIEPFGGSIAEKEPIKEEPKPVEQEQEESKKQSETSVETSTSTSTPTPTPTLENKPEKQIPTNEKPVKKSWAQISVSSVPSPTSPAPVTKPKAKPQPKEVKESSPKQSSQPLQNITNNGNQKENRSRKFEHLYPVVIKNTNVLAAQEIREGLEQHFGKTTKVEPRGNFALADFESQKSQQKALATKFITIVGSKVGIEEKGSDLQFKNKKPNNSNNTNNNYNNNSNNNNNNNNNNANKNKDHQKPNQQTSQKKKTKPANKSTTN